MKNKIPQIGDLVLIRDFIYPIKVVKIDLNGKFYGQHTILKSVFKFNNYEVKKYQ